MLRSARSTLAALLLAAAACASDPGDPGTAPADLRLPGETPSIIGTVTQASDAGDRRVVLIEQVPERSAGYPIANVYVGGQTRVLRQAAGGTVRARPADLVVGTRVRAWFTGPVRESYPVQADAGTVLIVD